MTSRYTSASKSFRLGGCGGAIYYLVWPFLYCPCSNRSSLVRTFLGTCALGTSSDCDRRDRKNENRLSGKALGRVSPGPYIASESRNATLMRLKSYKKLMNERHLRSHHKAARRVVMMFHQWLNYRKDSLLEGICDVCCRIGDCIRKIRG